MQENEPSNVEAVTSKKQDKQPHAMSFKVRKEVLENPELAPIIHKVSSYKHNQVKISLKYIWGEYVIKML